MSNLYTFDQPMDGFHYLAYAQEIIFAPGSLSRLGEAVERFGWQRILLCASRSLRASGHVAAVENDLGQRLAAVYDHVLPHVQDVQVGEVLALAGAHQVDAVIGMGGGSPIGMAKAVSFALEEQRGVQSDGAPTPTSQPQVAVIAIPSTYAGSEMTATYGITQSLETPPRKVTISDSRIAPKLVLYDPTLTFELPPKMTASTSLNALAHCFEALYSITRNPISSAAALSAIRHIHNSLLRCYQQGSDLEARSELLLGAHLAGLSLSSVSMGLHHGLCHVLGGTANVPHGIANSILLPHVLRFNAPATAAYLLPAVEALGIPLVGLDPLAAIQAAADKIQQLTAQMNLPQRLRDAGVKESDLPQLAALAFQNRTVQNNPKLLSDASLILDLLREAW